MVITLSPPSADLQTAGSSILTMLTNVVCLISVPFLPSLVCISCLHIFVLILIYDFVVVMHTGLRRSSWSVLRCKGLHQINSLAGVALASDDPGSAAAMATGYPGSANPFLFTQIVFRNGYRRESWRGRLLCSHDGVGAG